MGILFNIKKAMILSNAKNHKDGIGGLKERRRKILEMLKEKDDIELRYALLENYIAAKLNESKNKNGYVVISERENPRIMHENWLTSIVIPLGIKDFEFEMPTIMYERLNGARDISLPFKYKVNVFNGELSIIDENGETTVKEGEWIILDENIDYKLMSKNAEYSIIKPPNNNNVDFIVNIDGIKGGDVYFNTILNDLDITEMAIIDGNIELNDNELKLGLVLCNSADIVINTKMIEIKKFDLIVTNKPLSLVSSERNGSDICMYIVELRTARIQ